MTACTWASTKWGPRQSRSRLARGQGADGSGRYADLATGALHVQRVADQQPLEAQSALGVGVPEQLGGARAERAAGCAGSSARTTTWDVITATASARTPAWNGTSSRRRSTSTGASTTGRATCESATVSP